MSDKPVPQMNEAELREELAFIRHARTGKGRQKRREAKTKRISQAGKDRSRRKNVEAEAEADWV